MSNIGFVEAFEKFNAKLVNPMWAVSAIATDGAMVMSCWSHAFKFGGKGVLKYTDNLSRWGGNELGRDLLKEHLSKAFIEKLPVRLVIATTIDTASVDAGHDASKISKTFHIREDVVGQLSEYDGDNYVIEFKKAT
jgi:hypothetical protein